MLHLFDMLRLLMRYLDNFCEIFAVMRLISIWKLSVLFTQPDKYKFITSHASVKACITKDFLMNSACNNHQTIFIKVDSKSWFSMEWNKDFIFHEQEIYHKTNRKEKSGLYMLNVYFCWLRGSLHEFGLCFNPERHFKLNSCLHGRLSWGLKDHGEWKSHSGLKLVSNSCTDILFSGDFST